MKLSEIKGEKALDMFAELLEPISKIVSDKEITEIMKNGKMAAVVKKAIQNHKKSVIEVLAILEGKKTDEYECNLLSLPIKLLDILNDPYLKEAFILQSQETSTSSGSATVNTKENVT